MTRLPPMTKLPSILLMASAIVATSAQASSSQFVARMYTEALGRAPDEGGWANGVVPMAQSGAACKSIDFASIANNFYAGPEYASLGYTSAEKVLTLYRGLLNREPDGPSAVAYWAGILDSGTPLQTVVANFVNGNEFASLKDQICSTTSNAGDPVYRWGTAPAITIDGSITADSLQSRLNTAASSANKTVALSPRTVIYADRKITIPAGVTLTTSGVTNRQQYARMARIVRTAHFGANDLERGSQSLVVLENGAKMSFVWVSGQREAFINGKTLPHNLPSANVFMRGGTGTSVISSRLDTVAGNSNIGVDGTAEGSPCSGVVVSDNLITGYTNTHYFAGGIGRYADGITVACENTTVSGNHIVDASDVGIILFRSGAVPQASTVTDNIIVSAGISAFAAMAYEPYVEPATRLGTPVATYSFANSAFSGNRFWTSADSHFDIGISAGTRAWGENNTGTGGRITNNSNMGIASIMQVGIGVDGMQTTTITGNQLSYVRQANGKCPTKAAIVVHPDSSRASPGYLEPGASFVYGALDQCAMGDH